MLPTLTLGESAAAAAVGFINCFSGVGGFVGPFVVGSILEAEYSFAVVVGFLSICFCGAGALTFVLSGRRAESRVIQPEDSIGRSTIEVVSEPG